MSLSVLYWPSDRATDKQTNRETVINKQTNEQTKTFKQRDGNKHTNRQTNEQTNRKTFKQRDVSSKQTKKANIDTKSRTRTITFRIHRTLHRMPLFICLWLIVFRVCVVPSLMLDEYISKDTDLVKICWLWELVQKTIRITGSEFHFFTDES